MQIKTVTSGFGAGEFARNGIGAAFGARRPDLLRNEVLSDLFAATVARRPQRTAIVCGEKSWTYRALDEEATAWARGLVRMGVGPSHVVGLWMPRAQAVASSSNAR